MILYYRSMKGSLKELDGEFFGKVEDVFPTVNFSGKTVAEAETAFHHAVDNHLEEKHKKTRSRILISAGVTALLLLTMIMTCPDTEKHQTRFNEAVADALHQMTADEEMGAIGQFMIGIASSVVSSMTPEMITSKNYVLFSVGKLYFDGEAKPISIGMFNHVFLLVSSDDIRNFIEEEFK